MYNWDFSFRKHWIEEALEITAQNADKVMKMKPHLDERMEIAFYNIIDKRCDKAEEMNAPTQSICKNITEYTEKFIAGHIMSWRKAKELRTFTKSIVRIISNPPGWLSD